MADPTPPRPGLGALDQRFQKLEKKVSRLQSPSGTQRATAVDHLEATVAYLASLKMHGASGASPLSTGTVANDATFHWFATSPDTGLTDIAIPTGRALVTASCGEASTTPGGNFVVSAVTYSVRDLNNNVVAGHGIGQHTGRLWTDTRLGIPLSTQPQLVEVDPLVNPGPYLIRAFVGMWVAAGNTDPCSAVFQDVALTVQIIGDGVNI